MGDLVQSLFLDVLSGLIGTVIISTLVFAWSSVGPEKLRRWSRTLGWPVATFSVFAIAALTAVARSASWPVAALFGAIIVVSSAVLILFRFGPERMRNFGTRIRRFAWPVLTGVFALASINLLLLDLEPRRQVRFVVDLDHEEFAVLSGILRDLEPRLGARIVLLNESSNAMLGRLRRRAGGSEGPAPWDLMAFDNNLTGRVAGSDLVRILSPQVKLPESSPLCLSRLMPTAGGEIRVIPFRMNVKVGYYDKAAFRERGPPTDLEELGEDAMRLLARTGRPRIALQAMPGKTAALTLCESIGVDRRHWKGPTLDEVFRSLRQLRGRLHPKSTETSFDAAISLLVDNQVDLVCNWSSSYLRIVEDPSGRDLEVYPGWQRHHVVGGDCLAVPRDARNIDLALQLIELLLSETSQRSLAEQLCWVPIRLDAMTALPDPLEDAVRPALADPDTRPLESNWDEVEVVLSDSMDALLVGDRPVEEIRNDFLDRLVLHDLGRVAGVGTSQGLPPPSNPQAKIIDIFQ